MNALRRTTYRTLYQVLNRLSIWLNWKWIKDCKLFLGTSLIVMCVGESKDGRAEKRLPLPSYPIEMVNGERGMHPFGDSDSRVKLHADTIKEVDDGIMCYDASGTTSENDSLAVYSVVGDMPTFPGGSIQEYIMKYLQYPAKAIEEGITGKVYVQFIIEKNGNLDSVKVARSVHPLLDAEAVRVISSMPKWNPGSHKGKFRRVSYVIPVNFSREMLDSSRRKTHDDRNDVFCYVTEEMPVFPWGNLKEYVAKNLNYPQKAKEESIEGRVFVQFVIDTIGRVENVKVARSVHPLLDAEAIRIVKAMPLWEPGKQRGKKVRVSYMLPVEFRLKR